MDLRVIVESGGVYGYGHLSRTLVLCKTLKLIFSNITFFSRYYDIRSERLIERALYKYKNYSNVEELITKERAWFIVDCYDNDIEFESTLRRYGKILVLDDWPHRKHDSDILLDHNIGSHYNDYKGYVNYDCKILAGDEYMLIENRPDKLELPVFNKDKENRLLISLGGCDNEGWTYDLMSRISNIKELNSFNIKVLVSKDSSSFRLLKETFLDVSFELYDIVDDMLPFYEWASMAIGGAGVSAIERCINGIPSMIINLAENQLKLSKEIVSRQLAVNVGSFINGNIDIDIDFIELILKDKKLLAGIKNKINKCELKSGTKNILKEILKTEDKCMALSRVVTLDASTMDTVFVMQNEKDARIHFRSKGAPSWSEHVKWFVSFLSLPDSHMWTIDINDTIVGLIRVVNIGRLKNEISILISNRYRGLGVGSFALKELISTKEFSYLSAEVLKENKASRTLFTKVGFRAIDDTEIYEFKN
jgi:UDP-2,4-diacetamido-2,4,6-trideoxy-beta-L-altropyranose hydrolase